MTREDRMRALTAANERRHTEKREATERAIRRLIKSRRPLNVNAVAQAAGVSRNFIYSQPDLLLQLRIAKAQALDRLPPSAAPASEESLRRRLVTALDTIADLRSENESLRRRIENLTAQLIAEQ